MNKFLNSHNLLPMLLAILLVGQNIQLAHAKKIAGLKLQSKVINASVFNKEKNKLVIENAASLKNTVTVQSLDKSLKPVKIQGELKSGNLEVDLTKLGKANLLPQGTYVVTATRGNKKLKSKFELNPSTLYKSKISVPISNLSAQTKQRVLRYHHSGEASLCYADPCPPVNPDQPQCLAPIIEVDCTDPACNVGPCVAKGEENQDFYIDCHCYDPDNLEILGEKMEYPAWIEGDNLVSEITLETTGDYQDPDTGIKAEVIAYGNEETELSCIAFHEEAKEESRTVETELNNATTAAADVYIAAKTEAESLAQETDKIEQVKLDLSDLYQKSWDECKPLIELGFDKLDEAGKAVLANAAQVIAEEFKKAILASSGNEAEIMKFAAEKAAEFAAKCPNLPALPPTDLIKPEIFDGIQFHEIAGGLLDPVELGITEDSQVLFDIYMSKGVVCGSLKPPSEEEVLAAFKEGSAPIYSVNAESLVSNFEQIKEFATLEGEKISTDILIPPGCKFDPKLAVDAFKGIGINEASFTLAPTSIVEGQYDSSAFSGLFNFNAEPGVIADESFNNVFTSIALQNHDFVPGTVFSSGENISAALPSIINDYITNLGLTAPSEWLSHPPVEGEHSTEWVAPSGITQPTNWTAPATTTEPIPPSDSTTTVAPQPMPTAEIQPTYVPPTTDSYPMTH